MKQRITKYTFLPMVKQITFPERFDLSLDGFLVIANVTDNVLIFNFAASDLTGTLSGNVLTLLYDTSAMSVSDELQIWYDDGLSVEDASIALLDQLNVTTIQIRNGILLLLNAMNNISYELEDLNGE